MHEAGGAWLRLQCNGDTAWAEGMVTGHHAQFSGERALLLQRRAAKETGQTLRKKNKNLLLKSNVLLCVEGA